jgi:hypothetical protein
MIVRKSVAFFNRELLHFFHRRIENHESDAARVRRGLEISPVPLNLEARIGIWSVWQLPCQCRRQLPLGRTRNPILAGGRSLFQGQSADSDQSGHIPRRRPEFRFADTGYAGDRLAKT